MSVDVAPDRFTSLEVAGLAVSPRARGEVVRFGFDGTTTVLPPRRRASRSDRPSSTAPGTLAVPIRAPCRPSPCGRPTAPADVDLGFAEGTRLTGVRGPATAPTSPCCYAPPAGRPRGDLGRRAGRFTGEVALPNLVSPAQVAFSDGDRIVLPNLDRVVAYDLAGTEVDGSRSATRPSPLSRSLVAPVIISRRRHRGAGARRDADASWRPHRHPRRPPRRRVDDDRRPGRLVRRSRADGARAPARPVGGRARRRASTSRPTARSCWPRRPVPCASSTRRAAGHGVLDRAQGDVSDVSIAPDEGGRHGRERAEGGRGVGRHHRGDRPASRARLSARRRGRERHRLLVLRGSRRVLARRHAAGVDVTRLHGPGVAARRPGRDAVLDPHLGSVLDVDFSPAGSDLLTSADDGTMRVWDVDDWDLRAS